MSEHAARREPEPESPREVASPDTGHQVVAADLVGTLALAVITLITALFPGTVTDVADLVVAAVLFLGGCVAFGVGFVRAAGRSRYEVIDLSGLFYLTKSAPSLVRTRMMRLWFAQIAIAAASVAFVHPPFGVMAPVWGIGLNALWSGRYGVFPHREGVRRA